MGTPTCLTGYIRGDMGLWQMLVIEMYSNQRVMVFFLV
jgi:hypothetical protein